MTKDELRKLLPGDRVKVVVKDHYSPLFQYGRVYTIAGIDREEDGEYIAYSVDFDLGKVDKFYERWQDFQMEKPRHIGFRCHEIERVTRSFWRAPIVC